jgi:hypothetical protein
MVEGFTATTLRNEKINDNIAVITKNHKNSIAGCGSLSQNFSIVYSKLSNLDFLVSMYSLAFKK